MRKTFTLMSIFASCSFLLCGLPGAFAAEGREQVIIVMDASGSMWGQIDKEPKISIAKEVVKDLVKDWDSTADLGLFAYGHRRKGDCSDIELLMKPAPVQAEQFNNTLAKISPKGKTPLSQAVIMAAETLKYTEQKATVILVSDGIETCDRDPCEVARQLEAAGVDFTTHVVGFDVHEEEAKLQLSCLAEGTGGRYLTAENADGLRESLQEAVKEVKLSKKNNVELLAVLAPGGEPLMDVSWSVHSTAGGSALAYGRGPTPTYSLEPGSYIAKVKSLSGKATAETQLEVVADETIKKEVVLASEGVVKLLAVNEAGGKPLNNVRWNIVELDDPNKNIAYGRGAQPEYTLLPGKYLATVTSTDGKATATREIEVTAGKKTATEVVIAQEGIIKLFAVNEAGGKPLNNVRWNIVELDDPNKNIAYGRGAQPEYTLLPGKYLAKVTAIDGKAAARQEIEVIAGKKTTTEVLIAQEGVIKLLAVNEAGGKPLSNVRWNIVELEDQRKNVTYGRGAQPEYTLLPGKYLAKVTSVGGKASVEQEIEVTAGKQNTVEVLMPAEGILQLVAVYSKGGKPVNDVTWTIETIVAPDSMEKPTTVTYGSGAQPEYRLLPGEYHAKVKSKSGVATVTQKVEVLPLKQSRVEVLFPQEGEIELSALSEKGEKPSRVYWELLSIVEADSIEKPDRIKYGGGATPRYRVLPGTYLARATIAKQKYEKQVTVTAGKVTRAELTFSTKEEAG